MTKEFLDYSTVRNNAIKLAEQIFRDGFVPDVIYASLRGGAHMANVISEYFKLVLKGRKPVLYAAVVARSYTDVRKNGAVRVDGWTYSPGHLRAGDKILLVDDICDTGNTLRFLVEEIMAHGVPRADIKAVVHDYKRFAFREPLAVEPDYFCRAIDVRRPEDDRWIHFLSHELEGLTEDELEEHYFSQDEGLRGVFGRIAKPGEERA